MKQIIITLMEQGNPESPMIGTVIAHTEAKAEQLFISAVESHFDETVKDVRLPDNYTWNELRNLTYPIDAYAYLNDSMAVIEIHPTWIYEEIVTDDSSSK
jgi:hypothetical protein